MTEKPDYLPEYLARLSDDAAAPFLTEGLLSGKENVPSIELHKSTDSLPEWERWRLEPIRDLVDDALFEFRDEAPSRADAWLAPRLHATLRLTRAEAADRALWNYLAFAVAPDYVVWRHISRPREGGPSVNSECFRGSYHKQAFARLWWAAELFRDGPDYEPVVTACGLQDMLNQTLRYGSLIDHRPTSQALVRLLENGTVPGGREMNALTKAANAAAVTVAFDVLAPDVSRDAEAVQNWIDAAGHTGPVPRRRLFDGPPEEKVPESSVRFLTDYFADLFTDVPVRGRDTAEEPEED
ncbi:DUF6339 family protein [Streptomyces sp. NPDC002346]